MVDFFKGRLRAVEGSYFKTEQEAELKEYKRRRIAAGVLKDDAVLSGAAGEAEHFIGDKLAEISAAETRLSAPAEARRHFGRSQFPVTSAEGSRRERPGLGGGFGHSPRTSLGRSRWSVPVDDVVYLPEETAAQRAKQLVAQKAAAAGTRAFLYGSAAAVVVCLVSVRLGLEWSGVRSEADLRRVAADFLRPHVERLRASAAPLAASSGWAERFRRERENGDSEASGSGFSSQLRKTAAFRTLSPQPASDGERADRLTRLV
jgi:hypothetical protein